MLLLRSYLRLQAHKGADALAEQGSQDSISVLVVNAGRISTGHELVWGGGGGGGDNQVRCHDWGTG